MSFKNIKNHYWVPNVRKTWVLHAVQLKKVCVCDAMRNMAKSDSKFTDYRFCTNTPSGAFNRPWNKSRTCMRSGNRRMVKSSKSLFTCKLWCTTTREIHNVKAYTYGYVCYLCNINSHSVQKQQYLFFVSKFFGVSHYQFGRQQTFTYRYSKPT